MQQKTDVLHGLVVVRQEKKTVWKKRQSCIVKRHDDFDDGHLIHAVVRYCQVVEEGAVEHLFIDTPGDFCEGGGSVAVEAEQANEAVKIPSILHAEDASKFRALGFCVEMIMTQLRRMFLLQPKIPMDAYTRNGILLHVVITDFAVQAMSSQHRLELIRHCTPYWATFLPISCLCRFCDTPTVTQIEFRRLLAKELLNFSLQAQGRQRKPEDCMCRSVCGDETAPKFAGNWTRTEWTRLNTMYPQQPCVQDVELQQTHQNVL